jgi:hypothetical protein
VVCSDDICSDSHGYHCYPYERQVVFYDVDRIGAIAQGQADPWSEVPYTIWRPDDFLMSGYTCANVGGMAYDETGRRLFMVERGLGDADQNAAVVHIWTVR